jgi:hypothetical protein
MRCLRFEVLCEQKTCLNTEVRARQFYKYYVSGHYPSSCFYLKHSHVYTSKYNIFGDWILCQLSPIDRASPYLRNVVLKYKEDGILYKNRKIYNDQKLNICTKKIPEKKYRCMATFNSFDFFMSKFRVQSRQAITM